MTKTINANLIKRDILVIGASTGGLQALINLFQKLPCPLPGAISVVLHRHPLNNVSLREVLGRATSLPLIEASDEGRFELGAIYLAPADSIWC
ncbi:chemotaxis protein CheB [Nitrospira sp. Nam74]